MKRPIAVNNIIIIKKDRSYLKDDPNLISELNYKSENMNEIPEPYTGVIDSIGNEDCGYSVGEYVVFNEMGGLYLDFEENEYVVVTPEMIIGVLNNE